MKLLATVALLALTALPAMAQESHRDLAVHAVKAGYERSISTSIMATFWPATTDLIRLRDPAVNPVELFQYKARVEIFAAETASAALAPMVDLFDRGFSDEELQTLIAFYESPAGIKLDGAQTTINGVMAGAVGDSLKTEIAGFQQKIDAMLTADGF